MTPVQTFFKKISDPSEKQKLLNDLFTGPCEILAKPHQATSEITLLQAEMYVDPDLTFKIIDPEFELKEIGEIILQMTIGSEKYLWSTSYKLTNRTISVKTTSPIYLLQRREDFRLKIPENFSTFFQIHELNGKPTKRIFRVIDLSAGGCRLLENNSKEILKANDEFKATLKIDDRPSFEINGKILHSYSEDGQKNPSYGIQFINLAPPIKNKIAGLVMDLYRQLFSRLN